MTVSELITFLQTQPQNLLVCRNCYSEQVLLEAHEIAIEELGLPRADGWLQNKRPDKPWQTYLCFP